MAGGQNMREEGQTAPRRVPWATWTAAAACLVVFVGIHVASDSWAGMRRWGYAPASKVWDGDWWVLVTSAFVHVQLLHAAFNVYWLVVLGRVLERAIGPWWWWALCLSAAFVSSAAQLAWSDTTGIGFSGVAYGLFGFMWISRQRWPSFSSVLTANTVQIFLAWLVLCIVLTRLGIWEVGNAAHIAGFVYGALLGRAVRRPVLQRAAALGAGALVTASIAVLFYAPWSPAWTSGRAYRLHLRHDYAAAEAYYLRALRLGGDAPWIWGNLVHLYRATGARDKYTAALDRLRKIAPDRAREIEERSH